MRKILTADKIDDLSYLYSQLGQTYGKLAKILKRERILNKEELFEYEYYSTLVAQIEEKIDKIKG